MNEVAKVMDLEALWVLFLFYKCILPTLPHVLVRNGRSREHMCVNMTGVTLQTHGRSELSNGF